MRATAAVLAMFCLSSAPALAMVVPPPAPGPRIHLVGAGNAGPALEARLHDLLDDEATGVVIDSAPVFHDDEPFREGNTASAAPEVWLVLDGPRARLRAAGAGRTRFVFRDLEVAQPPTEFDRERLGQSVKAALGALLAGGPGVLSRADAAIASGVAPAGAPAPLVVSDSPPPPPPSPRFRMGAFYQAAAVGNGLFHGPGLIGTLSGSDRPRDPEIWVMAGYDVANEFGNELASLSIDALWARAGLSFRFSDAVRVGVGGGIDRQTTRLRAFGPNGPGSPDVSTNFIPVGRFLARLGPPRVAGVDVSLTVFLDVVGATEREVYTNYTSNSTIKVTLYRSNVLRPGLSLELWWR